MPAIPVVRSEDFQRARLVEDVMSALHMEPGGPVRLSKAAGLSASQRNAKFPTRLLRYAIPWAWMRRFANQAGPLRIAEIGVGSGQMKKFVDEVEMLADEKKSPLREGKMVESWSGLDIAPQEKALEEAGYEDVHRFNADSPGEQDLKDYDVVLLIHVLEHLRNPERFADWLGGVLRPGAMVISGVPAVPPGLVRLRERRLRSKYLEGGHWCKFSPVRARAFLNRAGLQNLDIAGAFLLRWSGSFLENNPAWFRRNFALARYASWWPGEIYFVGSSEAPR